MVSRKISWEQLFFSVRPPPVGNSDLLVFRPVLASDTWKNSGPGQKARKYNFPVLGALLGGKSGRPKSFSPKLRSFFTFYVLADRTPGAGNREILVPLALREIPGEKRENTIYCAQLVCSQKYRITPP